MNPRLEVLPLTEEDSVIFVLGTRRTWQPSRAMLEYMRADRNDADLMWSWQCQEMETLFMTRLERLLWLGIGLPVDYA